MEQRSQLLTPLGVEDLGRALRAARLHSQRGHAALLEGAQHIEYGLHRTADCFGNLARIVATGTSQHDLATSDGE